MKLTLITSILLLSNSFIVGAFTPQSLPRTSTLSNIYNIRQKDGHNVFFFSSTANNSNENDSDNNSNNNNNNNNSNNNNNDEAEKLKAKADELREQIRKMEEQLQSSSSKRLNNNSEYIKEKEQPYTPQEEKGKSLKNKRVLVVGANGRLGSMVTRYLLRSHPEVKEVVAAVHYVGEATTRGYGRLSYEVGAEDGVGTIGAAWSPEEERNARFEFSDDMKSYNLQNLRVVEVELLDPVQCMTITEDVDSIIWCATDFDGNRPKAIASLNAAFLFRAIAAPTKGRVEIEGLTNILGGLKESKQNKIRLARYSSTGGGTRSSGSTSTADYGDDSDEAESKSARMEVGPNDPTSFILVSSSPTALNNFETPFGEFNGLKRQGEGIVKNDFPSLSHVILQMCKFEDNFVEESLDISYENEEEIKRRQIDLDENEEVKMKKELSKRKINRRDAARAAVHALLDESLMGNSVEVWTALR